MAAKSFMGSKSAIIDLKKGGDSGGITEQYQLLTGNSCLFKKKRGISVH